METIDLGSTTPEYTLDGLSPDKMYQYMVGARDIEMELSAPSNVVQAFTDAGLPDWRTGVDYAKRDKVTYAQKIYACINPHHSQSDWAPDKAPSLWELSADSKGAKRLPNLPQDWQ